MRNDFNSKLTADHLKMSTLINKQSTGISLRDMQLFTTDRIVTLLGRWSVCGISFLAACGTVLGQQSTSPVRSMLSDAKPAFSMPTNLPSGLPTNSPTANSARAMSVQAGQKQSPVAFANVPSTQGQYPSAVTANYQTPGYQPIGYAANAHAPNGYVPSGYVQGNNAVVPASSTASASDLDPSSIESSIYYPQRSGVVVPAGTIPYLTPSQEPEGTIISSKVISTSPPRIVDGISDSNVLEGTTTKDRIVSTQIMGDGAMGYGGPGYGSTSVGGYAPRDQYGLGAGGMANGYGGGASYDCDPCGSANCRKGYVGYEALYFRREGDQNFSYSRGNFMDRFDYDYAHRITLGQTFDCTDGVEFVFNGPFRWNRGLVNTSSTGGLQSVFSAGSGYGPGQLSAFNNSIRHIQTHSVGLQSYEFNRKWFALDVVSTLIGLRAISYEEDYNFDSVNLSGEQGFFRSQLRNFLIGGHIGGDVFKPIGQRLSIGTRSRIGAFANFNEGRTIMVNNNAVILNSRRTDTDLAGIIESGLVARYRILPRAVITGGYEAWYLVGVATASDQRYVPITPTTGSTYRSNDTVLFHGATGGLEISW